MRKRDGGSVLLGAGTASKASRVSEWTRAPRAGKGRLPSQADSIQRAPRGTSTKAGPQPVALDLGSRIRCLRREAGVRPNVRVSTKQVTGFGGFHVHQETGVLIRSWAHRVNRPEVWVKMQLRCNVCPHLNFWALETRCHLGSGSQLHHF